MNNFKFLFILFACFMKVIRIFRFYYKQIFQMIREADADGDGKVGCSISPENINCNPKYPITFVL